MSGEGRCPNCGAAPGTYVRGVSCANCGWRPEDDDGPDAVVATGDDNPEVKAEPIQEPAEPAAPSKDYTEAELALLNRREADDHPHSGPGWSEALRRKAEAERRGGG